MKIEIWLANKCYSIFQASDTVICCFMNNTVHTLQMVIWTHIHKKKTHERKSIKLLFNLTNSVEIVLGEILNVYFSFWNLSFEIFGLFLLQANWFKLKYILIYNEISNTISF